MFEKKSSKGPTTKKYKDWAFAIWEGTVLFLRNKFANTNEMN